MGLFSKKKKEDTSEKASAKKDNKKDVVKKTESKVKADSNHRDAESRMRGKSPAKKEDKKDSVKVNKPAAKKSDKKNVQAHRFLLRPIISEKATIGAASNQYTFQVAMSANKVSVSQAIEEVYGVAPQSVNIINKQGKNVRFGRKYGRTKNVKKAIVTLKKGDTIKLYEGI